MVNDLALIRLYHPEDDLCQRRLSGTALSDHTEDLPVIDLEINIVQDLLVSPSPPEEPAFLISGADMIDLENKLICG